MSDEIAAALPNPGVSAWVALTYRARLRAGESVLILGATGVTGKLAVKIAKLLGAGRVVAAGRTLRICCIKELITIIGGSDESETTWQATHAERHKTRDARPSLSEHRKRKQDCSEVIRG